MWQRFTLYDLRVIGHYLGVLVMYSALLMAVPLVCAIIFGEWEPMTRYMFSIGIALFAGGLLRFCYIQPSKLNSQQALAVVGLAWVVLGVFCSIPLYLSGHYLTYLDALFDGVSGLTTTGASLIIDLDHLSYADNMFRFMMHLLGGLGLIVVALSLGIFGRSVGSSLFRSEARNEHVVPNVIHTTRFIAKVTAIVIIFATIVVSILMCFSGIEPARAILQAFWVSLSGFVTGGFTPMQQSILYYHSFPLEVLLMVLMIMGAVSFIIYAEVWKGRSQTFFRDIETRTAVVWLVVMVIVFTASMSASTLFSDLPTLLRSGVFMAISAFTTTGFSVITVNQLITVLTSGAFLTIALIMAVGGGAGSTAGGIKIYRVGVIAKSIVATVKQAVSPDSARVVVSYYHVGRRILSPDVVKEAMTVFILYVITYALGALVGIAHGYDASQAIFESVAMTSNGGIITGVATSGMPPTLELFYIFQMWVGRLEFITLLALVAQVVASVIPRNSGYKFKEHFRAQMRDEGAARSKDHSDVVGHQSANKPDGKFNDRSKRGQNTTFSIIAVLVLCLSISPVLSGCATQTVTTDAPAQAENQEEQAAPVGSPDEQGLSADAAGVIDPDAPSAPEGEVAPPGVEGDPGAMSPDAASKSDDDYGSVPQTITTEPGQAPQNPDDIPRNNRLNTSQLPDSSFIYDASIADLEHADPYMNDQTVQVVGEVVGDRIISEFDDSYCWIVLQSIGDSHSEITVHMPIALTNIIDTYGAYGRIGSTLQVRGTFNLACKDHMGASDLHAENVSLIAPGIIVTPKVSQVHIAWGILLITGSVICIFIYRRMRERQR